jgi:hypothetical protein
MPAGSAIGMKVISIAIGIPVGILTRKTVEKVWLAARPEDPPRKPSQRGVTLADAVGWAALSGASMVVTEVLTRRGSEVAFRAITGNEPPPPKPSKAEKKAQKKAAKKAVTA